jgi:hypothetical protein
MDADGHVRATGLAAGVARAAAEAGASVQLVGRIGEGPIGDAVVIDLTRSGVGHAASLRDAGQPTPLLPGDRPEEAPDDVDVTGAHGGEPMEQRDSVEPADPDDDDPPLLQLPALDAGDVELALRYLREFRAVVLAESFDPGAAALVATTAGWSDATVVAIIPAGQASPAGLEAATVLESPSDDADGAFASLVGRFVAGLDRGESAEAAFRVATRETGWQTSAD